MANKFEIFLSHSRNDLSASDKVYRMLTDNGFSVWRDKECLNDGIYAKEIQLAISDATVVIFIESCWQRKSKWMQQEIKYVEQYGKEIIYVLTDNYWGLRRMPQMSIRADIELTDYAFESKLIYRLLVKGCKPNTNRLFEKGVSLYKKANNKIVPYRDPAFDKKQIQNESFHCFLRAAELGNDNARSYIEGFSWDINFQVALVAYQQIDPTFIKGLTASLYKRGEDLADNETLTDVYTRGLGMERCAFRMMRRAFDLGYEGANPVNRIWTYLNKKDFEECLDELGESSRVHHIDNNIALNSNNISNVEIPQSQFHKSNNNCFRIFISYKRKDKEKVLRIKDDIERKTGNNCWIDIDGIESDAQFANVIIKAINNAQVFLFMYSHAHSEIEDYDTDWTVREINFAQKKRKRIVFVNIDGSPLTDWFELMFGTKQQIEASSKRLMEKLCKDLTSWLK